jgi:transcriptional regulator with XRE-family HTH domain
MARVAGLRHNAGSWELWKVLQNKTQEVFAALLDVDRSTISLWKNGKRRPAHEARCKLSERVGIDPKAWDQPAPASAPGHDSDPPIPA